MYRYVNGTLFGKESESGLFEKKVSLSDSTLINLQLWDVASHENYSEGS